MVNYAARRPSTNLVNGVDVLYLLELRRYYANCPAVLALLPPVPPLEVEEVDYSKRDHPTASRSIVVPENFHVNRPRFDVLPDKNLIAPDCAGSFCNTSTRTVGPSAPVCWPLSCAPVSLLPSSSPDCINILPNTAA